MTSDDPKTPQVDTSQEPRRPACPVCGGRRVETRQQLPCDRCHAICETCCEGGRG